MNSVEDKYFLGDWKLSDKRGILSIEKIEETYKCIWKINKDSTSYEYFGIGMLVDNRLFISRYHNEVPIAGIGMYKAIGDLRSNSALWASTQSFNTLGSGIALRKETSENFEGNYKVRYFVKEYESPVFDLNIVKKEQNDNLYNLNWAVNNEMQLHGIGIIHNGQMFLAYGGISFDYEIVILNFDNTTSELNEKYASTSNCNINEEIYIR